jgi:hypothetical protein
VDSFAVRRLTRLITEDSLLEVPRNKLKALLYSPAPHSPHRLLECPHCASVWAAFAVASTHAAPFRILRPLIYALAVSDFTSLYTEYTARKETELEAHTRASEAAAHRAEHDNDAPPLPPPPTFQNQNQSAANRS